jgi:hypothetical protein
MINLKRKIGHFSNISLKGGGAVSFRRFPLFAKALKVITLEKRQMTVYTHYNSPCIYNFPSITFNTLPIAR